METKVNEYRVFVVGLYGRNRSIKREGFSLIEKPISDAMLTIEELDSLVNEKIKSIKLKHGKVSVDVNEVTYKNEDGFQSKSFMFFDSKKLKTYEFNEGSL